MAALELPSCWNVRDRSPLLEIQQGVRVKYFDASSGELDKDAGAVRSNRPVPPACGLFYFEVSILPKDGQATGSSAQVSVGVCGASAVTTRLPGSEKNSWGYHSDTGNAHACSSTGVAYGPSYITGDVIGCGINFFDHTCFFTKNSSMLGTAFHNLGVLVSGLELYPCVGLRTPCAVEANFGQKKFLFDIDAHRLEVQRAVRDVVEAEQLPTMWQATLNQLVTSYLAHHGYRKTALTFARDSQTAILEADVSIQARQTISAHLLAGHLQEAVEATNRFFPGVLEANPHLFFRLQARKFVEQVAVRSAADYSSLEPLLSFGQELQSMCDSPRFASDANRKILQDAFSLMAYSDPRQGAMAYLLGPDRRAALADELNAALLVSTGQPAQPALESILQQTGACLAELRRRQSGAAAFLSTDDL